MGAPKGNKYAVGNGRPPKHTDPNKVVKLINEYFEVIEGVLDGVKTKKLGVEVWSRKPEPPTVTGLSLFLGFADKSSLYDYSRKESFSHPIKRAISHIEKHHEIAIASGGHCTGNIFALKNFGWKDKIEQEITTTQEIVWKEEKTYEANEEANEGT